MTESDAPPLVYKYRSWQDMDQKKVLTQREIFFASPRKLNDPCEFAIRPDYSQGTKEEVHSYFKKHFQETRSEMTDQEIDQELSNLPPDWWKDPKRIKRQRMFTEEHLNSNFGVFSCSPIPDSELMWALYADGDRGFCVGLNMVYLLEHFRNLGETPVSPNFVDYKEVPPNLNVYQLGIDALGQTRLIKSARWSFEKEIRLVLHKDTDTAFTLKENAFSTVTLGSKMLPCHKDSIIRILRGWKCRPRLFVRKHIKDSFDFEPREIFNLDFDKNEDMP